MFPKHSNIQTKSNYLILRLTFLCLITFTFWLSVGAQNFKLVTKAELLGVGNSSTLAFDADNDGLTDILVMGKDGSTNYTKLFHNNGDSTFIDLGVPFPGLAYGDADVIDYNNDGLPDIVISGSDGTQQRFYLFKNKGNNQFSEVPTNITGVDYCSLKCVDLNRDGWSDIIIAGQSSQGKIFKIYGNNGNGTFTEAGSLEGFYDGSFEVCDINNDSYPDIIACGVNNSLNFISKIYINQRKGFVFKDRLSNITPTRGGKIIATDFNNDGYADVVITGKKLNDTYSTEVYRNNGGESFTLFTSLHGLFYGSAASGDFNNDGFPDIILAGMENVTTYKTIYYINNGGTGFMEQATTLPDITKGSLQPIELTKDNKLDILINGYTFAGPITKVYNNDIVAANSAPNAPAGLTSFSQNDSVILRWKKPNDDNTPSKALTYDFYIKNVQNGDTVYTAPANYATGSRNLYRQGQLRDTFVIIKNLPYGKYSWSVQAVDQGYQGSMFAGEQTFNICYNFSIGADTGICKGSNISLSAGIPTDVVNWYSTGSPSTPFQTGNSAVVTVLNNTKVWVIVTKLIGCSLSDTINLTLLALPETLKKDTNICLKSSITLTLAHNNYKADWSSEAGSITATDTSKVIFKVLHDDHIYMKITAPNGCHNYDTTKIITHQLPQSYLPLQTAVCFHDTLRIVAGKGSDSVYWFNSNNQLLSHERSLAYRLSETENLHFTIIDSIKCASLDTIEVRKLPLPTADAGKDTLICPGGHARLGGSYNNPDNFKYHWSPSNLVNNDTLLHAIASPVKTTGFIMKITDTNSCNNYDTITVQINPQSTIDLGGDKHICRGKSIELGGSPTALGSLLPYGYNWSPAVSVDNVSVANPVVTPDTTTQYRLILSTAGCIIDTSYVKVNVWTLPVISKSNDYIIGYRENTTIWASGGTSYRWEPETGLSNNGISNPNAAPLETTTYKVFVTDDNGCESNAEVTVTIRNEIFVPNLFTPNGDGNNDYFKVYGTGIDKIRLSIYTIEGILIYEANSVEDAESIGWDGTYTGNPLKPGKYLWVLEAVGTDGKPLLFNGSNKGVVTLLR
jgi:gliding motility-associated-like protein